MAFVTVSVLLVGTIYGSSVSIAFGVEVNCDYAPNGIDSICMTSEGGKFTKVEYCYPDKDGKEVCILVYQAKTGSAIGTDLRNALENAELETAIQDTQNDTKVPKTGILDEPGDLSDDGSNEDGDEGGSDEEEWGSNYKPWIFLNSNDKFNKSRKINFVAKEYSLDKEQTSYDDLVDALRLALKGYNIE